MCSLHYFHPNRVRTRKLKYCSQCIAFEPGNSLLIPSVVPSFRVSSAFSLLSKHITKFCNNYTGYLQLHLSTCFKFRGIQLKFSCPIYCPEYRTYNLPIAILILIMFLQYLIIPFILSSHSLLFPTLC